MAFAFTPFDPAPAANNSGANSYASVADLRDYAGARGKSVPADNDAAIPLLMKAMDYLRAQGPRWKGSKTVQSQPLQWPRTDVWFDGAHLNEDMFDETALPTLLLAAQCEIAYQIWLGVELYPTQQGAFVKSEKVDVIETVYSEIIKTTGLPSIPAVDAILADLFSDGDSFSLSVVRA